MQPWFGGPRLSKKITKTQLGRIQIMACLAITGAVKSTSNGSVTDSDCTRPVDNGGGEDGTIDCKCISN